MTTDAVAPVAAPTSPAAPAAPAAAPAAPPASTTPAASSWVDATPATTPAIADATATDEPKNGAATGDAGADDTAEEEAKPEDKPAERKAPDAYEFKAPEGVQLDAELTHEFEDAAKQLNMPQDEAQAIVERMAPKIVQRMQAAQIEAAAAARADWLQQVQADPEIGGGRQPEVLATAARALDGFGTAPLRALLRDSGLDVHPEVIRFFYRAGKSLSADSVMRGKAPGKPAAQAIYAASNMNP